MRNEPVFSALTFSLGPYQLSCSLHESLLKLTVTAAETRPHQLALNRLAQNDNALELAISCSTFTNDSLRYSPAAVAAQGQQEEKLFERISSLENYVGELQRRVESGTKSRRQLRYSERRSSRALLKEKEQLPSTIVREREEVEIGTIIQKEVEQNMKLELLNDILQQKLLKREGDLLDLERSLMEREDLIRELAEKLITANIEKEDIFNEYDKILQTTVFHQDEKPKKSENSPPSQPSPPSPPSQPLQPLQPLQPAEPEEAILVEGASQQLEIVVDGAGDQSASQVLEKELVVVEQKLE